jgi:hypothetical protein
MTFDVPIRLQALNDAFQTVSNLYDRLEESGSSTPTTTRSST